MSGAALVCLRILSRIVMFSVVFNKSLNSLDFRGAFDACTCLMAQVALPVFLGACALGISACSEHAESAMEKPHLQVTNPLKKDTTVSRDYVCQIRAIQHIELRALERGYLENIHVDEGQSVKAGEVMFEIMPRLNQAEFKKAEAEAQFREIEYQNTERLTQTKITAPSELALSKAHLDKARAEMALAQVHLDFTQVKAPFDGIMGRFHVRKGSLVDEGELLTTLSDNHEMWVYFNVPEAEYIQYGKRADPANRMQVRLQMANNSLYKYPGVVTAVEADFNNETGNIAYRATFPNPDGLLRHGQTGRVIVDTVVSDAVLVPQKAVFEVLEKRFVLVAGDDGVVRSKEIKVSGQIPDIFLVKEGLDLNDKVLLEGQRKVNDGDVIVPVIEDPTKVLENLKVYAE